MSAPIRLTWRQTLRRWREQNRRQFGWFSKAIAALLLSAVAGYLLEQILNLFGKGPWEITWLEAGVATLFVALFAVLYACGARLEDGVEAGYVLSFVPGGQEDERASRHRAGVEHMLVHCRDQVDVMLPFRDLSDTRTQLRVAMDITDSVLDTQTSAKRLRPDRLRLAVQADLQVAVAVGRQLFPLIHTQRKEVRLIHTQPRGADKPEMALVLPGRVTAASTILHWHLQPIGDGSRLDVAIHTDNPRSVVEASNDMRRKAEVSWATDGAPRAWLFATAESLPDPEENRRILEDVVSRIRQVCHEQGVRVVRFYLWTTDFFAVGLGAMLEPIAGVAIQVVRFDRSTATYRDPIQINDPGSS